MSLPLVAGEEDQEDNRVQEMDVCTTSEPEPSEGGGGKEEDKEDGKMDTDTSAEGTSDSAEAQEKGVDEIEEEMEEEKESGEGEVKNGRLFSLVVVNSYGSQEVNRLKDDGKQLKLTSE